MDKQLQCIDLFSGCGGMSLGVLKAGFKVVAAIDNWDAAIACYQKNFDTHPMINLDISNWKDVLSVLNNFSFDVIVGGPPCQDFSDAGKRIEGHRAQLTCCFAKIVASMRPRYFVMENVERVRSSVAYRSARRILKKAGYGLTEKVLDASYCGVPQRRKRFFCIGSLFNADGFLEAALSIEQDLFPLTVREYFGRSVDFDFYYRHPRTYARRGIFSLDEPAPTIRGCNRPMPPTYTLHPKDASKDLNGIRSLTVRERAKIQTFPDDYIWLGKSGIDNLLIGNAVPVNLAAFVARCLVKFNGGMYKEGMLSFTEWLQKEKGHSLNAASDVISRFRRVLLLLKKKEYRHVDVMFINQLQKLKAFTLLDHATQTQLKRACVLYNEYLKSTL